MSSINVSPFDIVLDTKNPRFIIPPGSSQDALRLYLLDNEDIVTLAKNIVAYKGLIPGERIIVTEENGSLVAIEGNRRICSLQLLLNPELIPERYKSDIPAINSTLRSQIENIEADFIVSREYTRAILFARHVKGAKGWKTVSKAKFFANLFETGMTIDEIYESTLLARKDKIKSQLQEYYLLQYALDLPVWSDEQKRALLNITSIKPTPFTRIFNVEGSRDMLGLSFDPDTQKPISSLPKDKFDKAVELIATAVFITKAVSTRSELKEVPGLESIIDLTPKKQSEEKSAEKQEPQEQSSTEQQQDAQHQSSTSKDSSKTTSSSSQSSGEEKTESKASTTAKPPLFFDNFVCPIPNSDSDGSGILALSIEIANISTPGYLAKFPIAASMLLRCILEQTLKYHFRKINQYENIKAACKISDPSLQQIISYTRNNMSTIFPDKTIQRLFNSIFDNPGIKDMLDMVMHHTNLVRINYIVVDSLSKSGIRGLIENIFRIHCP